MITEKHASTANGPFKVLRGLSSNTKPSDVANGSEFTEIDSGKKFLFDEDGSAWDEQPGGGTSDYQALNNKPSINGVTLEGDMTSEDLNIDGTSDYDELDNVPIKASQTVYENDQTGTQGMLLGQAIYKIADSMASLDQLIGGKVNGTVDLTPTNTMDLTDALAAYGATCSVVAYSTDNFQTQTSMAVLSLDGPLAIAAMYTNIPSAGVWALATITSVALKQQTDIGDMYKSFFLPEASAGDAARAVQVASDGSVGLGIQPPVVGVSKWSDVKRMVKLGRGSALFPVHSILNVNHKRFGNLTFEVVAHDVDADPDDANAHTMTLLMLDGIGRSAAYYGFAFDEIEKLCVLSSSLAAGSYYINFGALASSQASGGYSYGDDIWGFTLTESVPSGGYLVLDFDYVNWVPTGMKSYTSAGVLIEAVSATENDTSGTDLTSVVSSSDFNFGLKARYGSSNYKESAIRQWLNASGQNWWQAKTAFDLPPDYVGDDGFLGGLDPDFVSVLLQTEQVTSTSAAWEASESLNSTYTLADKIFLASYTQVGGDSWSGQAAENSLWTAFSGLSYGDEPDRIKYRLNEAGRAVWWWLRSPSPSDPGIARDVGTDGHTYSYDCAFDRCGAVAAACVI